jgi:hypothetical protein
MNHFAKHISRNMSRNTLIRSMAALSILGVACMTASAQTRTLDNFTHGSYTKVLKAQSSDTHMEALPAGSPLGAARETVFSVGPDPYAQSSTLSIGKGICIVDSGFQADSDLVIGYGFNLSGDEVPLGLNLGAYSGVQLNLPAIATTEALYIIVEIDPSSGGYYGSEVVLGPTPNAVSQVFPYSSFTQGGTGNVLTPAEASDINYIIITVGGGGSASLGITSFQAVN